MGILPDGSFIQPAPHILFVHDEAGREWLKKRVEKLKNLPAFAATGVYAPLFYSNVTIYVQLKL